jgi:hypothetical protein
MGDHAAKLIAMLALRRARRTRIFYRLQGSRTEWLIDPSDLTRLAASGIEL